MLQDVIGHASILAFDLVRPCHIAAKIRRPALEGLKFIGSYRRTGSAKLGGMINGGNLEEQ